MSTSPTSPSLPDRPRYGVGPGLTIEKEREVMPEDYELTERLYTDAEKTRLVPENHPDAAYLLGVPGDRIPHDQAERLGLLGGADPFPVDAGEPEPAAETAGGAEADAGGARGRAKAVRQTSVADKALDGPRGEE